MVSDVEHLYMYLLAIHMSSLEKYLVRYPGHLLIRFFKNIEVYEFFVYFGCLTLTRYVVCKYFLSFHSLSFHFADGFLCYAENF